MHATKIYAHNSIFMAVSCAGIVSSGNSLDMIAQRSAHLKKPIDI
jgi:23S rRNA G2069 N7-methylase RlmK/C1962 C5-methylase RlmI